MRLLVVEDEPVLAMALRRGLSAEGFTIDVARDGEQGLELARTQDYAAVVLDIMLPKLSGYRVCERLRSEGIWVPVLMLSAKDGEYDEADGLDLGADDYLTKPFSFVVLVAHLRALIRRGQDRHAPVLGAGDLAMDLGSRVVTRGDVAIPVTQREYALLEFMLRRRGRLVSKAEILTHVWNTDAADPNLVEVYVGYLRKKIDAPFGRHALVTVRGKGYRLAYDGG
jgi:DNA-binding response OmpR family regulator